MSSVFLYVSVAIVVWIFCTFVNLFWYKKNSHVIAKEFHYSLIIFAPLAAFIIVVSVTIRWLSSKCLQLVGIDPETF